MLNITAIPEDKNSIVTTGSTNLNVGENTITIIVTAQDKTTKEYKIHVTRKSDGPTTTIDKFLMDTSQIYEKTVNINIENSNIISKEILDVVNKNKLTLFVNKYDGNNLVYRWIIEKVSSDNSIDTSINFDVKNKEKIEKITNYANGLYFNFSESKASSDNVYVEINVSNMYKDGTKLYLYNYDNKSLNKKETVIVKNGLIKTRPNYSSDNFLSMYDEKNNAQKYLFVIVALSLVNFFMIVVYFVGFRKYLNIKKSK